MPYVYILECADGTYYVGSTWNLDQRMEQHSTGSGAKYTARRLPVKLVFTEEYDSIADAFALEKRIQGWSRRKRQALIRGDYEALPELSSRRRPRESWRIEG